MPIQSVINNKIISSPQSDKQVQKSQKSWMNARTLGAGVGILMVSALTINSLIFSKTPDLPKPAGISDYLPSMSGAGKIVGGLIGGYVGFAPSFFVAQIPEQPENKIVTFVAGMAITGVTTLVGAIAGASTEAIVSSVILAGKNLIKV